MGGGGERDKGVNAGNGGDGRECRVVECEVGSRVRLGWLRYEVEYTQ